MKLLRTLRFLLSRLKLSRRATSYSLKIASLGIATLINGLLSMVAVRATAKLLGGDTYGPYVATQSLIGTIGIVFGSLQLRTATSVTRGNYSELADQEVPASRFLPKSAGSIAILLTIGWSIFSPIVSTITEAPRSSLLFIGVVIPFSLATAIIDGALYGLAKFTTVQLMSIMTRLFSTACVLLLLAAQFRSISIIAICAFSATPALIAGALILKSEGLPLSTLSTAKLGRHTLNFVLLWAVLRISPVLAPRVLGAADSSQFVALYNVISIVVMTTFPLALLLIPLFHENRVSSQKKTQVYILVTFIVPAVFALAISLFSKQIIQLLFPPEFAQIAPKLRWMVFSAIPWSAFAINCQIAIGADRPHLTKILSLLVLASGGFTLFSDTTTIFSLVFTTTGIIGVTLIGFSQRQAYAP